MVLVLATALETGVALELDAALRTNQDPLLEARFVYENQVSRQTSMEMECSGKNTGSKQKNVERTSARSVTPSDAEDTSLFLAVISVFRAQYLKSKPDARLAVAPATLAFGNSLERDGTCPMDFLENVRLDHGRILEKLDDGRAWPMDPNGKLESAIVGDFCVRNKDPAEIKLQGKDAGVVVITREKLDRYNTSRCGRKEGFLQELEGNPVGLLMISGPGYSQDGLMALVYTEYTTGPRFVIGWWMLLGRSGDSWRAKWHMVYRT